MTHATETPAYRPDIDGLRAVAVVPVVLFHAGIAPFSGGFVGVDIFFVISGYLITALIARQALARQFSFGDFYVRRIRRLFPALWAVLAFSLAAGYLLLLPGELADTGRAAQRVVLFVSNHLFWHTQNDYWSQNALSAQPLLHTWSLAVEEQFYLVLPVCLAMLVRHAAGRGGGHAPLHRVTLALAGLAAASFVFSQWLLARDAPGAFYILASRAWELLLGGLLALATLAPRASRLPRWAIDALGAAGLALIGWSVLHYTEKTPFPAAAALLPCAGAALLIWAGIPRPGTPAARVTRLLSWRPLVFVGLISYSLYLWHWPLLVFARSVGWRARGLPEIPAAVLLAGIAVIAWLSYRFIERPFRRHGSQAGHRRSAYAAALAGLLVFFAVGKAAVQIGRNGTPIEQPIPAVLRQLVQDTETTPGVACEGSSSVAQIRRDGGGCPLGLPADEDRPLSFVLLGDSHARMWTSALGRAAKAHGNAGVGLTRSNCTPLAGLVPPSRRACADLTYASLDYIVRSPIPRVILAGYWVDTMEGIHTMVDAPGAAPHPVDPERFFRDALARTLARLQAAGKQVYLLLDVPELASNQAPALAAMDSIAGATGYGPTEAAHRQRQARVEQDIAELRQTFSFTVLDPARSLCSAAGCVVARQGRTLYRDKHHLTDAGAQSLAAVFEPVFGNTVHTFP